MDTPEEVDVVVVGGGPGGSTVSTLVAMQGHRVMLFDRERFPRYQIGESLLPSTVHGICTMLGVGEELKRANFTRKLGGSFRWGKSQDVWSFQFGSSGLMAGPTSYAYQVERTKFDAILLENAKRKGVRVREGWTVQDVTRDGGRVTGVVATDGAGRETTVRARFVVDASGNQSRLYAHAGERVISKYFQNVALFCYFEGGKRLPPPQDGNVLSAAFNHGWFWYIPLSPTLTSVGAVVAQSETARLKDGYEEAMRGFIESCPLIRDYLANATRVTEGPYGQFRVRKDYSYCNTHFWIPGLVLIGDAACFIDPVFSSGVHLATYSGLLAARSINTVLAGGLDESTCFDEFEARYRREFGNFYQFLVAFYDMEQEVDTYFWNARKILNTEEKANEAFVRLVSGISSTIDPTLVEDFFRPAQTIGGLLEMSNAPVLTPQRLAQAERSPVVAGLTRELQQIQVQAALGSRRAPEAPLLKNGLIPSADGFHWRTAVGVS
jgi:halogenation protein CepH